jgi:hypothetical protein
MLAGMKNGVGESMFPHMTATADQAPSPEEMEKAMQAVQFDKVVTFKAVEVRTYNLSDKAEAKKYTADRKKVMEGMQQNNIAMLYSNRHFVEAIPGYIAHMEWVEFELKVDPVTPAARAPQGDTNG